ncbi:PREDICTED: DNA repair protein RadA [Theobroma cacao]|uniref:DNA repair protein RadA n=1 Tax=Theobroma cacao TaxID=3641 RepID=A0AB32WKX9_THECC|nr:PREDICTED: DNA repair protein RadA [Theobroma cacao]
MKAIRSIYYTHKHFLLLNPTRIPISISFLSRHFHLTNPRFALNFPETDGTDKTPRVWTVYEPLTGELSIRSSKQKSTNQDVESGSGDEENADFETERTYGKAKNANWSNGTKIHKGFSGSNDRARYSPKENTDGMSRKKTFSVNGLGLDIVGNKKKGKGKVRWVCEDCGYSDGQWWGVCRSCDRSGTMKRFTEGETKNRGLEFSETVLRSWLPKDAGDVEPVRLMDVNCGIKKMDYRIPLLGPFGNEVARVLGGGLVPGSLVLIGGDPGVGKSTLLLQMAALIAEGQDSDEPASVVYVSGEESVEQISSRAERMKIGANDLFLYSGTDIEDILMKIQPLSPRALIVDSIQTVYLKEVTGSAGGLSQVRECTSALLRFAKKTNIPVLLVGHVTKSGDIAGPRVLEHIVDAVLYLEGEKCSSHRLLRSVKNRFGSTDELGVFEMSQLGLQAVSNPSEMFLSDQNSDSEFLAGLAVAVIMDGSRAFLIEIQALCVSSSTVSRHVNGIQASRADMIISVLAKQAGLKIQENAVFLNVVSGVSLTETAGDLAIAASICSSFLEFPIPNGVAFIGEIGLGGELRMVPRMDKRVSTVAKLGYKKCIVPMSAEKSLATLDCGEMEIIGCKDLKEVINNVFTKH